jgi:5-methylcytosine-specific restriction endonuclease McrA
MLRPDRCVGGYGERQPDAVTTFEHLTPRAQGGGAGENLALACRRCNLRKGDLDALSYLRVLGRV